ncbi:MAG TPA: type II toxin-antitoxin system HigB family toxin [Candidatus Saccharimonadales bacterium]|jgi:mRNA interferase HigB|nr:type II toxin-antitoxin system HigB family toxin [Candidatus Saccharimonadales bacterium]
MAWDKDNTLSVPLRAWFKTASSAKWSSIVEVKKTYPNADFVDPYTVFNIRGNNYRLITKIEYRKGLVFIKDVLTHIEYDKKDWKK